MAQFLKSHSPDELWKASLKPKDPLKPDDLVKSPQQVRAAKESGTGLVIDVSA